MTTEPPPQSQPRLSPRASALWSLALLLPAPSLSNIFLLLLFPGTTGKILAGVCKVWMILLPCLWHVGVDRQPIELSKPSKPGLLAGFVSGLLIFAFMMGFFALIQGSLDPSAMQAKAAKAGLEPTFLAFLLIYVIFGNSLMEEYIWRWFVYTKLEVLMPTRWSQARKPLAVIMAGLLFGVHHIFGLMPWVDWKLNALGVLGVCLGAWIWSGLYAKFRSIWPGYISHVCADIAIAILAWKVLFA